MRRPLRRLSRDGDGDGTRNRGRLAVPLGAAVVALLASAGPAIAGSGYGQLIVNPGTAAPGQSVSVLGTCPNNGTGLRGVYSSAFAGGAASVTRTSINFSGSATIAPGASGTYTVTADCGPGSPSVNITVAGAPMTSSQPVATSQAAMPPPSAMQSSAAAVMPPATTPGGMNGYTHAPMQSASPMQGGGMGMGASTGTGMGMGAAASGSRLAMSAMPGATSAGNGPVTSTGIIRVGLAGASRSALTTAGAAAIAVALVLTGAVGFLAFRRRRRGNTSGSHI